MNQKYRAGTTWRNIIDFLKVRKVKVTVLMLSIIGSGCSNLYFISIISSVLSNKYSSHFYFNLVITALIISVSSYFSILQITDIAEEAIHEIRLSVCEKIINSPLKELESNGYEKIYSILSDDLSSLKMYIKFIPSMLLNMIIFIGGLVWLSLINTTSTYAVITFLVLGVVIYIMSEKHLSRRYTRINASNEVIYQAIREMVSGIKELKLSVKRKTFFLSKKLRSISLQAAKENRSVTEITAVMDNLNILIILGIVGTVYVIIPSDKAIFSAFIFSVFYLSTYARNILTTIPYISHIMVISRRIASLNALEPEVSPPLSLTSQTRYFQYIEKGEIVMENVSYRVNDDFEIGPINFSFKAAEATFIVGGNGQGKSTLLKLISGLYLPQHGMISYNGQHITKENLSEYRECFSAIFQNYFAFRDVLLSDDTDNELKKLYVYIQNMGLANVLNISREGSIIGHLSYGQEKRLALVNSLSEDKNIYIFDEWAADQDPEFKEFFYKEVITDLKLKGKIVIVVTHDDRYYKYADSIIKLESGIVV